MAFLLLALVVSCVVFGLFSSNLAYNILLSLIHLLLVIGFQFFLIYLSKCPGGTYKLRKAMNMNEFLKNI